MKEIIKYFIKMLLCTFGVLLLIDLAILSFGITLFNFKYGTEAILETIMLAIILIVLKKSNNLNILVKKKEKTLPSLKYGGILLLIIAILFLSNVEGAVGARPGNILNLILYCILIGISEELLCRGWIQNSFLKRFGKSEKGAFLSILFASLVFGFIHITNVFAGNTILETVAQILQTTSLGFLLGMIYYKSGNIWTPIILHATYDFAIMTAEVGAFKDCVILDDPTFSSTLATFYSTLILILLYIVQGLKVFKWDEENKVRNRKYNIALVVLFMATYIPIGDSKSVRVCYNYESKKINEDYEISYIYKDKYSFTDENNNTITLNVDDENKLTIKNETTNESTTIEYISSYKVIKKDNNYKILMEQNDGTSTKLLYLESNLNEINNLNENIKKLDAPYAVELGYIETLESNEQYFIIRTDLNDIFIIEDDKNIYLLKR